MGYRQTADDGWTTDRTISATVSTVG